MSELTQILSQLLKLFPILKKMDLKDFGTITLLICSIYFLVTEQPPILAKKIGLCASIFLGVLPIIANNFRIASNIDVIYYSSSNENEEDDTNLIEKNTDDFAFLHITDLKMLISQISLDLHIVNKHVLKQKIIEYLTTKYHFYLTFSYFSDQLEIVSNLKPKSSLETSGEKLKIQQRYIITQQILKDTFNCAIIITLRNFRDNPKEIKFCFELEPIQNTRFNSLCAKAFNKTLFHVQKKIVIHH